MRKTYRTGAIGAVLDEYERAIEDLKKVVTAIPENRLTEIIDAGTQDENCRSLQTILSHVVHSGYGYATGIYNAKYPPRERPAKTFHYTIKEYIDDLNGIFAYTEQVFGGFNDYDLDHESGLQFTAWWGQRFDVEQMIEHAIVHILRHRRQLERLFDVNN